LMLASTIQISNNNPTPLDATPPPHRRDPGQRTDRPGTKQPHPTTPSTRAEHAAPGGGCGSDSSEPQQCAPTHQTRSAPQTGAKQLRHPGPNPSRKRARVAGRGWGGVDDSTSEHHHQGPTTRPPAQRRRHG
jgi:hypothetical protein